MKINPIFITSDKHITKTPENKPSGTSFCGKQKSELYSSDESFAIKNIYGSTIKSTKSQLKKEADALLEKRGRLFDEAFKIKQQCQRIAKDDYRIKEYATGMYKNAYNLYMEGAKYEDDSKQGFYKTMNGNTTNLAYFDKGKLKKILINARPDGDKIVCDHAFKYLRGNVIYQKNAVSKDNDTVSCDEEYYYIKGELQKYDKGIKVEDDTRHVDETRLYKKGKIFSIAQDIESKPNSTTTSKIYYFDQDGFDAYIENMQETADRNAKEKIYDYTYGVLTSYMENQEWTNTKSKNDLKMEFRDDRLHEAFVNSEMTMTSYMTADKQFQFENNVPTKVLLGYERSSIGTESSKKEVNL